MIYFTLRGVPRPAVGLIMVDDDDDTLYKQIRDIPITYGPCIETNEQHVWERQLKCCWYGVNEGSKIVTDPKKYYDYILKVIKAKVFKKWLAIIFLSLNYKSLNWLNFSL